jgi:hypothetical protein
MSSSSTLSVVVADEGDDGSPGGTKRGSFSQAESVVEDVSADVLRENLSALSDTLSEVFEDLRAVGNFTLQEVRLQVEVSASGGVQLVGTAKAGGKGAITLTFRPQDDE